MLFSIEIKCDKKSIGTFATIAKILILVLFMKLMILDIILQKLLF